MPLLQKVTEMSSPEVRRDHKPFSLIKYLMLNLVWLVSVDIVNRSYSISFNYNKYADWIGCCDKKYSCL